MGVESLSVDTSKSQVYAYTQLSTQPLAQYIDVANLNDFSFQAIQMQLSGPVPSQLYHRYVEFKPFIAGMFQAQSLRGRILHKALHHQHQRIYNFDRSTLHGVFPEPCREFTQKFLEFVSYGQGGRIFTYVITLDGQLRFTETGKEFGIDMLSKHTMHSDVSIYIAYSGEFFIRRRKHRSRHRSRSHSHSRSRSPSTRTDPPPAADGIAVEEEESVDVNVPQDISTEPGDYELFIDNDSGTYRPNSAILPQLKEFLEMNFPGLHITTLASQEDAEVMGQMKEEQRNFKKEHGHLITYLQQSSASSLSISSSEEEELNERSGEMSAKKRGDLSRRVHEMRDVKGQMMRWVEDGSGEQQSKREVCKEGSGRERASSMS